MFLLLLLLFICSIPLSICLICIHFIFISLFHRYSYLLACLFKHLNIRVYRKCSGFHGNLLERVICNLLNYEIVLIENEVLIFSYSVHPNIHIIYSRPEQYLYRLRYRLSLIGLLV